MKKIFTLLAAVIITANTYAQSPEKMSYQAVLRDASDKLLTNQSVGMQISILQGSVTGTALYIETHSTTTNINGLVSIEIGNGSLVAGSFTNIDWTKGPYFIKTETDPTGGTSYTIKGTSQLVSVPFALHANTASSIIGGITEADPIFGTSVAKGISAADTAYWNTHTIVSEKDPLFGISIANGITAADTANWNTHTVVTETDPLFGVSIANGITATDTANWNNHTVVTETDPLFGVSIANGITATDTANWNKHTINTNTQLDSTAVAAFGYVAGIQTISRTGTTVALTNGGGTFTDSVNVYTAGTNINITGNVISSTDKFYLGQDTLGGFVFYVYKDANSIQHGLIVAKKDTTAPWQATPYETVTGATSTWNGSNNTSLMTNSPARTYVTGLGTGWYIPANDELNLLWQNRYHVNQALYNANLTEIGRFAYWSSTELNQYAAYSFDYSTGIIKWTWAKYQSIGVRGVRAF
ncbi:hypothetical protein ACFLRI_00230 [Bacteroidota bacterium]